MNPLNNARKVRKANGSTLLELPVSLWMVFVVFMMPMIALSSITMRATLMMVAVQDAVQGAAKAKSFTTSGADGLSAKDIATARFANFLSNFAGLQASAIDLDIVQTTIVSGQIQRFRDQLPSPSDTNFFMYQIEGKTTASIDPIFPANEQIFGRVAGLTTPIQITLSARQMAENAQGLNR